MKYAVNVPTITTIFSGQILSEKHFSIIYLFNNSYSIADYSIEW